MGKCDEKKKFRNIFQFCGAFFSIENGPDISHKLSKIMQLKWDAP